MKQLFTGSIIALLSIIFALQNAVRVNVKFMIWTLPEISLALLLILALIIGIIICLLYMASPYYQKNKIIQEQKTRLLELEKRIGESQQSN
jgi:uncharacterized integral membrane protein